jgi:peptidylprolyl isomerase
MYEHRRQPLLSRHSFLWRLGRHGAQPPPRCLRSVGVAAVMLCGASALHAAPPANEPAKKPLTTAEVLAASAPSDWRPLDLQNTVYLELASGRVVIELMPQFAPNHVANLEALARGKYFDGLWIYRSQDN